MAWVFSTAILLLIGALADPPKSVRVITDEDRPINDYFECRTGNFLTPHLVVVLFLHHIYICIYIYIYIYAN
jgi:hypothetical protein